MATLDVSENFKKSEINSELNTSILTFFLMGMYTIIYLGTIYIHYTAATRSLSKSALVTAAITILYVDVMVAAGCQWYIAKWQFVDNGDTRDSVFLSFFTAPVWSNLVSDISLYISFVIADGLLIWRCFNVWNHSLRIILVSLLLVIAEIALLVAELTFHARNISLIVPQALAIEDTIHDLLAAALFFSFATTLVTTILIAYRIYSVSKQQLPSSRRFNSILDIVVQSGAIYAFSQLAFAISTILPDRIRSNTRIIALQNYTNVLNMAITGILPTVMVARVSLLSTETAFSSTSINLSGLQFHAGTSHPTVDVETMAITQADDADRISAGEKQAVDEIQ